MATHEKIAQLSKRRAQTEIERAAGRAGIRVNGANGHADAAAIDKVAAALAPTLAHATELCGEMLASMLGVHDGTEKTAAELNALLWRLRWELGLAGKAVDADHDEDAQVEGVSS